MGVRGTGKSKNKKTCPKKIMNINDGFSSNRRVYQRCFKLFEKDIKDYAFILWWYALTNTPRYRGSIKCESERREEIIEKWENKEERDVKIPRCRESKSIKISDDLFFGIMALAGILKYEILR